jgi:hypothetical protein
MISHHLIFEILSTKDAPHLRYVNCVMYSQNYVTHLVLNILNFVLLDNMNTVN